MLAWLGGFLSGIFSFLSSVLPGSPFQSLISNFNGLATGLGWLNWFVPIGDFGLIFAGYLTVLVIWTAVQAALDNSIKGVFGVLGGE